MRARIVKQPQFAAAAAAATLFSSTPVALSSSFISLRRSLNCRCHSRISQRSSTSSSTTTLSFLSSKRPSVSKFTTLSSLSIVSNGSSDRQAVRTTIRFSSSNSNDNLSSSQQQMISNRVALLQLPAATINKSHNIQIAQEYILRATNEHGASLCILPEIWNSPYATSAFPEYAEVLPNVGDTCTDANATTTTTNSHDDDDDCTWGESATFLMNMAKITGVYIVGGSIPEVVIATDDKDDNDDDHENKKLVYYYNTCLIIDPAGRIVGKHRKLHLFDISIPNGGIQFKESDILSPGNLGPTYFDHVIAVVPSNSAQQDTDTTTTTTDSKISAITTATNGDNNDSSSATAIQNTNNIGGLGRIGIGICYDIRFPEYAQLLTQKYNCTILIYPGAFNLSTGPAHWELLQRARAVDNQCFVITVSPARMMNTTTDENTEKNNNEDKDKIATKVYPPYYAWGHSSIISPWGTVIDTCNEEPTIIVADLDMNEVTQMRNSIPSLQQKRNDLYRLIEGS